MAGFLASLLWQAITWNDFYIPRAAIGAFTGSAG